MMTPSRIASHGKPARLLRALRLVRHLPAGRRLLSGGDFRQAPRDRAPAPYDPLEVADARRVVRRIGRRRRVGSGLAAQVVAAFFIQCDRRGWHCALHAGDPGAPPAARLELWRVPVLKAGDPEAATRCVARSGGELRRVGVRRPEANDATVARVASGASVHDDLARLLDQLGGLAQVVTPGGSVLLKANFNSHHPPPASTGLDLLSATVDALRRAEVSRLALGECSAIALGRTRTVLERAGLPGWAADHGVELRCFDEEPWDVCPVAGRHVQEIVIPACLPDFDHIIYLLCAKTHHEAGVSLGLKMTIGLMHPAQRLQLHEDHLLERIADASLAVRPDLAILDARQCFVTGGPSYGAVAAPGVLLAARQLEPLEQAGLDILAEHGAVGLDTGRRQLACALGLSDRRREGVSGVSGEYWTGAPGEGTL